MDKPKFGEYLIKKGVLNFESLGAALNSQKSTQDKLGQSLVKEGFIRAERLNSLLSEYFGMDYLSLMEFQADPTAIALIPQYIARKLRILPVQLLNDKLLIAVTEPLSNQVTDNLRRITGKEIDCIFMEENDLVKAFDFAYINTESLAKSEIPPMQSSVQGLDAVSIVDKLLEKAISMGASDMHFEPEEEHLRVRFRIDGKLKTMELMPIKGFNSVISRIKVLAGMNITEKRIPQDCSFQFTCGNRKPDVSVNIRVSTIPGFYGEKAVLSLQQMGKYSDITKLGLEKEQLASIYDILDKNQGIFLTTGPAGSGKTTTLYAAINHVQSDDLNIMTVEDPIEYPLKRVTQTEVDKNYSYKTAIHSILRQDPDIIMVDEIRDGETAKFALQAALTGHAMLSSLYGSDSISAILQLVEMGCEEFLVNAAVNAILTQRLVRVLCPDCKHPYQPKEEELMALGLPKDSEETFYYSEGCPSCNGLKYKGRTGIFELLVLDKGINKLLSDHGDYQILRDYAIKQGLVTLRQDGIKKMRKGITSFAEVLNATSK